MKPTTITIPPGALSAAQIAAILAEIQASLPYYRRDGVTFAADRKTEREVVALSEHGTLPCFGRLW